MKINNSKIWAEGKYVDIWSIPHVLCGVILAGIFYYLGLSFINNLLLSFFIMFGWEFFELYVLHAKEHFPNKIMDVVTGMLGFFIMYYFIIQEGIDFLFKPLIYIIILFLILNAWGLYAHYTRKK